MSLTLSKNRTQQGFTLIEMLMAMVVFALLALSSATILKQTIQSDEISRDSQQRLKQLQRTMTMFERDFGQMVARASNNGFGEASTKLFEYGDNYADSDAQGIRFHRLGWLNPQGRLPRGSIQQVIYRLEQETLQRQYTLYPDPVEGEEPLELDLLDGVIDLQFAFYIDGNWVTQTDAESFPQAIAVEIELEDLGKIRRHILLAEGAAVSSDDGEEGSDNNGGNNGQNNGNDSGSTNNGNNDPNGATSNGGGN